MSSSRLIYLVVGGVAVVLLLILWLFPKIQSRYLPEPRRAWVGIEVAGTDVARVGTVELLAGTGFRLHAVLEAESPDGETVYYTQARRLEIGGNPVPDRALRRWDQPREVKLLWFSVEGDVPYLALQPGQDLGRLRFQEFFRPEWGTGWSVEGGLGSHFEGQIKATSGIGDRSFGTQRYQVWIELFESGKSLPVARLKSPGSEQLRATPEQVSTVVAVLPGAVGAASRVFGLTQTAPPPQPDPALLRELAASADRAMTFTRLTVLQDLIRTSGESPESLGWRRVDLETQVSWGGDVGAGDLLRVGARVVVLWQDSAPLGVLDGEDLCFDFDRGAAIRRLKDVFIGSGDLELARLSGPPSKQ